MKRGPKPGSMVSGSAHHNYKAGKLGSIQKGLTQRMKNFLAHYVEHGNATEAVMQSYNFKDRNTAANFAWQLKQRTDIREVLQLQQQKYQADVPEAYKVQKDIMTNEEVKAETRLKASMDIQDRAGLGATSKSISLTGKANIAELFKYDNPIERKIIVIETSETSSEEDRLQKTKADDKVGTPRQAVGDSKGHGEVHNDSSGKTVREDDGSVLHSPQGASSTRDQNMDSSTDL